MMKSNILRIQRGYLVALMGLLAMFLSPLGWGADAQVPVGDLLNTTQGSSGDMPTFIRIIIVAVVLLVIPAVLWGWLHNGLVSREEQVLSGWAQVESNYQRRADLIPRLVESVSRYVRHERETLEEVTAERNEALAGLERAAADMESARQASDTLMQQHASAPPADEAELAAISAAQARLRGNMMRFMALVENYPNLKAGDQFLTLQAQLEGTENRINVARMRYNEAVQTYNRALRTLPSSLVAQAEGFQRKAYFQADEGAEASPALGFHD